MTRSKKIVASLATERAPASLALHELANVGPATLGDFKVLGVRSVAQLARRNPWQLYESLCRLTHARHDPCCIDVFLATVHQARTGEARDWWSFTAQRKLDLAANPSLAPTAVRREAAPVTRSAGVSRSRQSRATP
jgi:Pathogenicity locus